jgi:predicted RNase H-like HicB family nuclease
MTPALIAGGFNDSDNIEVVAEVPQEIIFRYARPVPERTGASYSVLLGTRGMPLSVILRRSEHGWVALAHELDELGHGETLAEALASLHDSVEQYLEFLRDDQPALAPAIAQHAMFVGLLDTPPELWFGSVSVDASALE